MNRKSTANPVRIKFHYYLFILCVSAGAVVVVVAVDVCVMYLCVLFYFVIFWPTKKKERTDENMIANIHIRMNKWMCRLHHHRRRDRRTTYIKRLNLRPFFSTDSIAFARLRFPFVRLSGCSIAVESAKHLLFSSFFCVFILFVHVFFCSLINSLMITEKFIACRKMKCVRVRWWSERKR